MFQPFVKAAKPTNSMCHFCYLVTYIYMQVMSRFFA